MESGCTRLVSQSCAIERMIRAALRGCVQSAGTGFMLGLLGRRSLLIDLGFSTF